MKAKYLLLLVVSGLFGVVAHAQTPGEVFNMGVIFDVAKCTQTVVNGSADVSCSQAVTPTTQNVAVTLSQCESATDGSVTCQGNWSGSLTVDSVTYSGMITVQKYTDNTGASYYGAVMSATDNQSNMMSNGGVMFANGTPTDMTVILGNYNISPSDSSVGYASYLAIGQQGQGKMHVPTSFRPNFKRK